jgi:hypothetical protein
MFPAGEMPDGGRSSSPEKKRFNGVGEQKIGKQWKVPGGFFNTPPNFRTILVKMLTGEGAHVLTKHALSGLDWELAGRKAAGFSPYRFPNCQSHDVTQEFCLTLIKGKDAKVPPRAVDSWPGS